MSVSAFKWNHDHLEILDQRLLPHTVKHLACRDEKDVAAAIREMAVRGAPAIGCCAAYGMALALKGSVAAATDPVEILRNASATLKAARPTAVNHAWAVDQMMLSALKDPARSRHALFGHLVDEARRLEEEDVAANKAMAKHGAALFKKNSLLLTHCNTGALATAGYGTALGIIREAHAQGKIKKVLVDETRPYLQGARLTAWELDQENIPHELITDSMAAFFMKAENVTAAIVGCDRVAANGDTANKIGTYGVAVLAKYHGIPFYVAMPSSTLDVTLESGADIPIEDRPSEEVVKLGEVRIAPLRTKARHPAFDVTPAELITAFITEHGVVFPPFIKNLKELVKVATPA